jgi:hypothetical protein
MIPALQGKVIMRAAETAKQIVHSGACMPLGTTRPRWAAFWKFPAVHLDLAQMAIRLASIFEGLSEEEYIRSEDLSLIAVWCGEAGTAWYQTVFRGILHVDAARQTPVDHHFRKSFAAAALSLSRSPPSLRINARACSMEMSCFPAK